MNQCIIESCTNELDGNRCICRTHRMALSPSTVKWVQSTWRTYENDAMSKVKFRAFQTAIAEANNEVRRLAPTRR